MKAKKFKEKWLKCETYADCWELIRQMDNQERAELKNALSYLRDWIGLDMRDEVLLRSL